MVKPVNDCAENSVKLAVDRARAEARPGNVRAIEAAFRNDPRRDKLVPDSDRRCRRRKRVDRGKEDRVRTDAERERDDGDDGEPGLAKQAAEMRNGILSYGLSGWTS